MSQENPNIHLNWGKVINGDKTCSLWSKTCHTHKTNSAPPTEVSQSEIISTSTAALPLKNVSTSICLLSSHCFLGNEMIQNMSKSSTAVRYSTWNKAAPDASVWLELYPDSPLSARLTPVNLPVLLFMAPLEITLTELERLRTFCTSFSEIKIVVSTTFAA